MCTKQCSRCRKFKILDSFNKDSSRKDRLYPYCKECRKVDHKIYYKENRDKILARSSKWAKENCNRVTETTRRWQKRNPDRVREYNNRYKKEKRRRDDGFRIQCNLRTAVSQAIRRRRNGKGINIKKYGSAIKNLGCTIDELVQYLESKFRFDMNWENYGKVWEIDHIIPLVNFDLTNSSDFLKAVHYTNLQPLSCSENRSKGAKIT